MKLIRKNIKIKLFLILLLVLLIFLLNRFYARIYTFNGYHLAAPYSQNNFSLNNPSFQNTIKYVALGDSLSAGVGSTNVKSTLPFIFAQKLSQEMSVEMVNLAVPGATSKDLINFQLKKAISEKPNYISLFIGVNDVRSLVSPEIYAENLNYILDEINKKTQAKIVVFNLPYIGSEELILPPFNLLFDFRTRQFNQIIQKECQKRNLTLINLYNPTKEVFNNDPNFYSIDQFHPSDKGYILWGSLLDESIY